MPEVTKGAALALPGVLTVLPPRQRPLAVFTLLGRLAPEVVVFEAEVAAAEKVAGDGRGAALSTPACVWDVLAGRAACEDRLL